MVGDRLLTLDARISRFLDFVLDPDIYIYINNISGLLFFFSETEKADY